MLDQPKNQIIRSPNPEPAAAHTCRYLESFYTGQANKKKTEKRPPESPELPNYKTSTLILPMAAIETKRKGECKWIQNMNEEIKRMLYSRGKGRKAVSV
jgi:hypothetical protein